MAKLLLIFDALINFLLGVLLLFFSPSLAEFFGVPPSDTNFYPNILGGVFIGITIALLIEAFRKKTGKTFGLGLTGAVSINMCGGIVLFLWLIFGNLDLPVKGYVFLWILAALLVLISSVELLLNKRR